MLYLGQMPGYSPDAIVVPGGGLLDGGRLPTWVENRLSRALEIAGGDAPVVLLSAGTYYKPHLLAPDGRPIYEARAAAAWLIERGFPASRIYVETASYDTVGNAYFLRVMHTDPRRWRRLRVVTSEFHIPRLRTIFDWMFSAPPVDPPYELEFESVADAGMTDRVRTARAAKEAAGLASFRAVIARVRTLEEIHRWLFTEHEAYAVAFQGKPRADLPEDLMETY